MRCGEWLETDVDSSRARRASFSSSSPRALCALRLLCIISLESAKMSQDPAEQNIQMWKVKKLIKSLDSARG